MPTKYANRAAYERSSCRTWMNLLGANFMSDEILKYYFKIHIKNRIGNKMEFRENGETIELRQKANSRGPP